MKSVATILFGCAAFAAAFFVIELAAPGAELRAGRARIDITPPLSLKPSLGGYGDRMNQPATGVHDRIFAKVLVLAEGNRKFALVTVDALGFAPPVKTAVLDRLADKGWSSDNLMLLASHSHTAIEMNALNPLNTFHVPQLGLHNPPLFEVTMKLLAQVVADAETELVPVAVGTSSIKLEGWNRNRRIPGGITDPELTVTRIDRLDGKPFAVFVNWTAHPTFMSELDMWFSGDWPGHMQRTLESLIGDDVQAMYANGAEGDQSTIARPNSGESHWERAERYGRDLGIAAWGVWKGISPAPHPAFGFWREEIELPKRQWHPNFKETGGKEYGMTEDLLREMLPKMFPTRTASVSLRLGELVIVGIPGELAAKLGLEIKRQTGAITGAKHPIIGGLADEWISYILPIEQYTLGKYEASMSFYGSTLADVIVKGALAGVENLQKHMQSSKQASQ
ncbi:MAG TPA: neutral/alkaline non-lysosomal ceramidase N-terminal domain-containing protein [Planctomycetaceae bacterium]|nr:neutral/alkaline non-lysosomal ceramidase N-terminal domain-containing protein [Planctomycetaceae bacterium]